MAKRVKMKLAYALSFAAQLGFLIVAPLVGFIWLGIYLDGRFAAGPTFLLTGVFLALTVTGYETYRMLEPLLKHDEEADDEASANGKKPPAINQPPTDRRSWPWS